MKTALRPAVNAGKQFARRAMSSGKEEAIPGNPGMEIVFGMVAGTITGFAMRQALIRETDAHKAYYSK
eukprot:CAMPEP_0184309998 /NCGR_PEP_ID=MMETSP1049-20130417/22020_1 /TAXON_ID=77928 /ORGANISM="Proteomonas sulcata, Strain CCMP704" /LENGTH=67 /DNA_ID=CAMNT_0026623379 /DNA_START=20 /DNA_END=223 /DNA_ORIENTATION=+